MNAHEGNSIGDDLYRWWMDLAHEEAEAASAKADEYGSNSMTELGHEINKIAGRAPMSDADATELACYFYIKGKIGRWSDAILAGRAVSNDTLADIGVYVRMVQRVRSNGGWPGAPTGHEVTDESQAKIDDAMVNGDSSQMPRTCCFTFVGGNHTASCEHARRPDLPGGTVIIGLSNGKVVAQDALPGWEGTD